MRRPSKSISSRNADCSRCDIITDLQHENTNTKRVEDRNVHASTERVKEPCRATTRVDGRQAGPPAPSGSVPALRALGFPDAAARRAVKRVASATSAHVSAERTALARRSASDA